jgi:membrane protein YdbS with pleckstrin-like domain
VDVVVTTAGLLTAAGAHLLPWYASTARPSTTVNGFGQVSEAGYQAHANHLQWMIALATIGAVVLLIVRAAGGSDSAWRQMCGAVAALAIVGAVFSVFAVPETMMLADGVWIAATGSLVTAFGVLLLRRAFD